MNVDGSWPCYLYSNDGGVTTVLVRHGGPPVAVRRRLTDHEVRKALRGLYDLIERNQERYPEGDTASNVLGFRATD